MKKILKFLFLTLAFTGFSVAGLAYEAKTEEITNVSRGLKIYKVKTEEITIISRGVEIPVAITVPIGAKGEKFPLVVIAHGHGGSKEENGGLTLLAEKLGERGIATIRMDFPGCGKSTEPFTKNTLTNMMADIKSSKEYMLKKYSIDPEKTGIFGYSMGGRLALMSAKADSYKSVVLLAPAVDDGQMLINNILGGKAQAEELYKIAEKNGYADFTTIYGQKQKLSKGWFDDLKDSHPLQDAGGYTGEVLVIYGDKDTVVPGIFSFAAAGAVVNTAKSVKTLVVRGADHGYGFYSDQAELKNDVVNTTASFFIGTLKN